MVDGPRMLIDPEVLYGIDAGVKHTVLNGESLKALAKELNIPWQELAEFNYGTTDVAAIKWYIQQLVCNDEDPGEDFIYHLENDMDPVFLLLPKAYVTPTNRQAKSQLFVSRFVGGGTSNVEEA